MVLDGLLQLLDVFRPPLSEGGLCLSVALLALFGGGINLFAFASQHGGTRHCIAPIKLKLGNGRDRICSQVYVRLCAFAAAVALAPLPLLPGQARVHARGLAWRWSRWRNGQRWHPPLCSQRALERRHQICLRYLPSAGTHPPLQPSRREVTELPAYWLAAEERMSGLVSDGGHTRGKAKRTGLVGRLDEGV
jgi:hypothetical protein